MIIVFFISIIFGLFIISIRKKAHYKRINKEIEKSFFKEY